MSWEDDRDRRSDLCADLEDDRDCGCGSHHDHHDHHDHHHHHHHRGHRRRRLIPIGNVTVDCTPVTFRTPGQAVNVVSCPVSWIIPGTGCVATIHTPPIQTPVLPIFRRRKPCGCH